MECIMGGCWKEMRDETDGGKGAPLKHDPQFKGPIRGKSRRPQDIICLGVFLAFIVGMLSIAIVAFVNGRPERLVHPTDSKGRLCGVHKDVMDKPYLLFFDIKQCATLVTLSELLSGDFSATKIFTCPTPQVCVKECPEKNEFGVRNNPVCVDDKITSQYANITSGGDIFKSAQLISGLLNEIANRRCAPYYLDSTSIAGRCIPTLIDLDEHLNEFLNLTSDPELEAAAANQTLGELLLTISVEEILNGSFAQALLVETKQFLLDIYRDLELVWPALAAGVVVAMIISLLYILLMWCCAPIIVWGTIILAPILIAVVAGFSYYQFYCFQDTEEIFNRIDFGRNLSLTDFLNRTHSISNTLCVQSEVFRTFVASQLPWFKYQKQTWLSVGIIGTVMIVILILILIFLGRQIRISIAVIQEASKAVAGVPSSVLFPMLIWALLILLFLYWAVVAVFLLTSSVPTYRILLTGDLTEAQRTIADLNNNETLNAGDICDIDEFEVYEMNVENRSDANGIINIKKGGVIVGNISCLFDEFVTSNTLLGLQIYNLFGLLWIGNYILAVGECTLAGAFAAWYWAYNKPKDVPFFAVMASFGRAVLFHSGSLAFGAILIAIIQMIRIILTYLQKKLKNKTGRVAQVLLCLLKCCFFCLEKILRYVNRQAYIEIAIYGYKFCTAACKVVKLLLRNILRTAVKDRIVAFLLFLGKVVIVCLVGILAYVGFGPYEEQGRHLWGQPLNYYLIPVLILMVAAYFIASGFMSVFHLAVDTIFICALEDYERNDGSKEKPYFMSDSLKGILKVKNRFEGTDDDVQMVALDSSAEHPG